MTVKPWQQKELEILFEGRSSVPLKTYNLIGHLLDRDPEAVRAKWKRTDWKKLGFGSEDKEYKRFVEKSEFKDKQVNLLDRRFSRNDLKVELIVDAIERSVEALPKVDKPIYKTVTKTLTKNEEDVGLLLSDLHIGHQHTLEDTGGISQYNNEIFLNRLENLKSATTEIVELHSKLYKLPKLHIFCAGDIVAGMNDAGSWSPLYIATPIVEQMIGGFDALSGLLNYWLGLFEEIHFYGVGGNHGRTAKLGIQKDVDNWDYVAYKFLETTFKNNDRIKFNIPKSWWLKETIKNHTFLMVHGDYIKGGGGMPLKGLLDFEEKMSPIIKEFPDYTLAGHFHNASEMSSNTGRVIINGSFVGSDVYSLRDIHAGCKPEQKLFGINESHGITWSYNINLDIDRK